MATLETQYKIYKETYPSSKYTFEEWKSSYCKIYGLDPQIKPSVSDDFQIGYEGAYEHNKVGKSK